MWQSFSEVRLKLAPSGAEPSLQGPLAVHKDWINSGGALQRISGPDNDNENAVLVVHQTKRAVTVLWGDRPRYAWSRVYHHTPYDTFVELGWGNPHAVYVRIPTPSIVQERLPAYIRA